MNKAVDKIRSLLVSDIKIALGEVKKQFLHPNLITYKVLGEDSVRTSP